MARGRKSKQGFNTPFAGIELSQDALDAPSVPPPPTPTPTPTPAPQTPVADDQLLFAEAMRGVERRASDGARIEPRKRERADLPDDNALVVAELEGLVRGEGRFDLEDTGLMVSGRVPGVSQRTVDQLERGRFAVRRHIDLHGCTRAAARDLLNDFIGEARRADARCVLVVTGRGLGSPNGLSVLREALPRWLSRAPLSAHVLAFCTAQSVDGGPGAFYVLLRRPGIRPYGA